MSESKNHSIRFINSNYDELFRIPDGARIQVEYPDHVFTARCEYMDDYHTRISGDVYHICQFAEMIERGNAVVSPEPELPVEQAAWQIGHKEHLSIQAAEAGWDYSIYDKNFREIDGGRIDLMSLTIQQCRDLILEDHHWQDRNLEYVDYDRVEDRAADVAEERLNSTLEILSRKKKECAADADSPSRTVKKEERTL